MKQPLVLVGNRDTQPAKEADARGGTACAGRCAGQSQVQLTVQLAGHVPAGPAGLRSSVATEKAYATATTASEYAWAPVAADARCSAVSTLSMVFCGCCHGSGESCCVCGGVRLPAVVGAAAAVRPAPSGWGACLQLTAGKCLQLTAGKCPSRWEQGAQQQQHQQQQAQRPSRWEQGAQQQHQHQQQASAPAAGSRAHSTSTTKCIVLRIYKRHYT
jgi:hypothetical protein